jgi:hypothetical protein
MKRSKVAFPCKFPIDQSSLHLAEFCKAAKAAIKRFSTRQKYLGVKFLS